MKIPFGFYDHKLVHISEVESGRTNVQCPYCKKGLIAKKGRRKRHHFAHDKEACTQHFSKYFFSLEGRLPTHLPLFKYADKKLSKIQTFQINLEKGLNQLDKKSQQNQISKLKSQLQQLERVDATEVSQQIDRYLQHQVAPFPEFHRIRLPKYEYYTDGKQQIPFEQLDANKQEYYYPLEFAPYVQILKNFHRQENHSKESIHKLALFKKDLALFQKFNLYFFAVQVDYQIFYKIGLTSRPIAIRQQEIIRDLQAHFLQVELKLLFQSKGVAFLELFFKQKFMAYQYKIGSLTEYFKFEKSLVHLVLKDLFLLENQGNPPKRTDNRWIDWLFFNFSGKIYGYVEKSVYVKQEKFILNQEEAKKLELLMEKRKLYFG